MSALGNLVVSLALETAAFSKGIDKSSYEAQKFAHDLDRTLNRSLGLAAEGFKGFAAGALGAVGVTLSVSAAVTKLNDTFARMDDLLKNSQRFGIQVEELSKLGFAAQMSGVQTDKLGDALKDLLKNAAEAAAGAKGPKQAFDSLGLSVQDLDGKIKPASKLIEELSGRFSQMPDGALKSNAAMKIFGESGLALIPMLNAGEEGIRKMNQEAERFGLVVSTDAAKAAEIYNDNLARLNAQVDGLFISVGSSLLPALNDATESFLEATKAAGGLLGAISAIKNLNVKNFISENITGETLREREIDLQKQVKALEAAERRGGLTSNPFAIGLDSLSVTKFLENFDINIIKSTSDLATARGELAVVTKALADAEGKNTDEASKGGQVQTALNKQQEEYLKRLKELMGSSGRPSGALSGQALEKVKNLNSAIDDQIQKVKEQLGQAEKATEADKLRAKAMDLMKGSIDGVTAAKLEELEVLERAAKIHQEEIKLLKQRAAAASALVDSATKEAQSGAESAAQRTKQLEDEIARIGLKTEAVAELEARTLALRAAELRQQADALGGAQSGETAEEMLRQVVELERQIALVREKSAKEVAVAQIEENNRIAKQFEDDLIDAFEEAFLRGGDFAESFSRAVEAQFAKMVLRPAIEAVIRGKNPIDAISSNPSALASLQAFSNFSTGGSVGLSLGGVLSNANNITANLVSISGASGQTAASMLQLGNNLSKIAPYAGSIAAVIQGDVGGGLGSAAGTYIGGALGGPLGAAIGGAIGSAIGGKLFGGGKISASGLDPAALKPITDATQQGFDSLLKTLGGTGSASFGITGNTGRQGQNANFTLSGKANNQSVFSSRQTKEGSADGLFLSGEIALNEANIADQTTRAIVAALKLSDFADNIDSVIRSLDPFNASLDELNLGLQNAQILSSLNEQFKDLGGALGTLSGASIELIGNMFSLTGGIEGLQGGLGAFYDAFYTEQEKTERLIKQVTTAFANYGAVVPTTRDGLRELVDGLDLQDAKQQALFATILQLTPALDQLIPAFEKIEGAARSLFGDIPGVLDSAIGKQISLSREAADQARESARAFKELSKSLTDVGRGLLASGIESQLGTMRQQFRETFALAMQGDRGALSTLGGQAQSLVDSIRTSASSGVEFAAQASLIKLQVDQAADVARALGVNEDYQAQLFDIQSAALELLKDQVASGKATEEILNRHSELLSQIGTEIALSSGKTIAQLLGLELAQLENVTASDLIARFTGGSESLLNAVLNRLTQQDNGSVSLIAQIQSGNFEITNYLSQLVAAVKQQSEAAAAAAKRAQDIAKAQSSLQSIVQLRDATVASVQQGIGNINSLASQTGVRLSKNLSNESFEKAIFEVTSEGLFRADFDSIFGGNPQAFKNAFYSTGGAFDQTYGQANALQSLLKQIQDQRDLITSLGGIPQFAKGGVFTNSIVSQPTLFNMAEMGEAGPEAIMPLARGPNGLGVRNLGGSGNSDAVVAELRMLRQQMAALEDRYKIIAGQTLEYTKRTSENFQDLVDGDVAIQTISEGV